MVEIIVSALRRQKLLSYGTFESLHQDQEFLPSMLCSPGLPISERAREDLGGDMPTVGFYLTLHLMQTHLHPSFCETQTRKPHSGNFLLKLKLRRPSLGSSWRAGSGPQQTELIAQESHVVQRGSSSLGPFWPLRGSVYGCPGNSRSFPRKATWIWICVNHSSSVPRIEFGEF